MIDRVNVAIQAVSDWGDANLVKFNATKTQASLFVRKTEPNTPGCVLPRCIRAVD